MTSSNGGRGLLVTQDVFFASKITGTASALGLRVDVERIPANVPARLTGEDYRGLFIDLATPGLDVGTLMASLPKASRPRAVAFGSHVHTAHLQAARTAGCEDVMPRSRLSANLPEILRENLQRPD